MIAFRRARMLPSLSDCTPAQSWRVGLGEPGAVWDGSRRVHSGGASPFVERRVLSTRVLRDAVAGRLGIHPGQLALLDAGTIERMAWRLEGRGPHRRLDADDVVRSLRWVIRGRDDRAAAADRMVSD